MKLKKLSVLALSLALMAGCSNGGKSENKKEMVTEIKEPVEITFWHAMNGDLEKSLQDLTNKFMEENKNITVTLQNQSSYNDLQQKVTATFSSPKDLPTLTQAYPDWMVNAIQDDLIVDLKPYINNETLKFDNYDDILPSFREENEKDGKIYGLPFNKSTEVLWYNKNLFNELNLQPPKTYEEFKTVAQTIKNKKGIVGGGFDSLNNYYVTFLKNEGANFDNNFDVTSDKSVKAVDYYLDGIKNGYFRIAGTDNFLSGPFASEKIGMYVGSNAGESFIKQSVNNKFEIGVAPYPSKYSMQQGTNLYIFSSATAEQQTAAYEYLKFLTTTDNQITWAKETGYIPDRQSSLESEEYKKSTNLTTPIIEEATKGLFTKPVMPGSDSAYRESATVLESILTDKNPDVKAKLEQYKNTLMGIWE